MKLTMYILEHPTKGVVTAIPGERDEKYHYSWSGLRSDESTRLFALLSARKHKALCAPGTVIREYGTWNEVL